MKRILNRILLITLFAAGIISCRDDFPTGEYIARDGEAVISATIDFYPLVTTVNNPGESRGQSGDLISSIDDLTVFLYDIEGNLCDIFSGDDLVGLQIKNKNEQGANTSMPNDAGGKPVQAEESTARATFKLQGIPFGQYYIYAVANMGEIADNMTNRSRFAKVDDLRNTVVEWNESNIAANSQMFGYFTASGNDTKVSAGFDAPIMTVSRNLMELHAWIKRAASKVTVVFDGSGLKEDIWIYIKSVTIKDIPRYCKIGADNSVHTVKADSMIAVGDKISYISTGVLPADEEQPESYKNWLEISNGTP